jgi:hypothetical protein
MPSFIFLFAENFRALCTGELVYAAIVYCFCHMTKELVNPFYVFHLKHNTETSE